MRLSVQKRNLLRRIWSALSDSRWFISKDTLYDGWRPSLLYGVQVARYFSLRNRNHQIKLKSRETRALEALLSICIKPDSSIRLRSAVISIGAAQELPVFLTTPINVQIFFVEIHSKRLKADLSSKRLCWQGPLLFFSLIIPPALLEYLRFEHICKLELSRKHCQICGAWAVYDHLLASCSMCRQLNEKSRSSWQVAVWMDLEKVERESKWHPGRPSSDIFFCDVRLVWLL